MATSRTAKAPGYLSSDPDGPTSLDTYSQSGSLAPRGRGRLPISGLHSAGARKAPTAPTASSSPACNQRLLGAVHSGREAGQDSADEVDSEGSFHLLSSRRGHAAPGSSAALYPRKKEDVRTQAQGLAVSFLDINDEPGGGATPAAGAGRARSGPTSRRRHRRGADEFRTRAAGGSHLPAVLPADSVARVEALKTPTPDSDAAILAQVRKRVDAKDPRAIEFLASAHYLENHGLQQDIPQAIELWTKAANLGDLGAHYRLGFLYCSGESGEGVEIDEARGVRHWQHAAIHGHPESRLALGVL
ncbi:hypothetical protein THAOC_06684 [Thalassiosira oceanica]|uniref:Uncharacterized protein n=1 Tax=Thalassiosira oceanica TaxID=159749 RepID=K0T231_THAOC|nr:hypothetical protein THAOC_06684 [Thalassiosira oceanica]|eukprot:EJK71835.1 hypothetical protein THAOC_06684 [Thalassiosira oceanica]